MEEKYDIFISYSQKDSKTVLAYAKYLEDAGYRVWYDVKGLFVGAEFSSEIAMAIENSRLFVFFSSNNSNESQWTKGEVLTAKKFDKPILPVRIDQTEYDKSLMLVLLPLQYIDLKSTKYEDNTEELRKAVYEFIGEPLPTTEEADPAPQDNPIPRRKGQKLCTAFSILVSILLSLGMMFVSGEDKINLSLSLFTLMVTSVTCILVSLYIIYKEKNWEKRATIVNLAFLFGIIFFLSYTMMAFGLCFISLEVFKLNFPSIGCAVLALFAFYKLMDFKKTGYVLLWISAALFAIGSYWWLGSFTVVILLAIVACVCMAAFTMVLKSKHEGRSFWDRMG